MKNKKSLFLRISNFTLFIFIMILFFSKIILYILIKNNYLNIDLGGGSDANYYDAYAKGYIDSALNFWAVILRFLNEKNIYSREFISYLFLILNLFFIPVITTRLADIRLNINQKYYFYIILLCFIYPTLYFFTFDIYRDLFMVISFLIGCLAAKESLNSSSFLKFIIFFALALLIGNFLILLRPYLGVAFISALFLWNVKFTKKRLVILSFLYLIVLFIANYLGLFESITEYRAGFETDEGGSTLGLDFSNPVMFVPNFILSFLGQMLGLYITNPLAIILLLVETMPFLLMLIYVIKNIRWADKFVRFLIVFFVLYASIWLIGNDNLGTAVRLRFYNYFTIYISFFYILQLKAKALNKT